MEFKNPYLTAKMKIDLLANWIITQSIIYYHYNKIIVSDKNFDENCIQFLKLIKQYPNEFKSSRYYYIMKDFNGSTGYDLYYKLNDNDKIYFTYIAQSILQYAK